MTGPASAAGTSGDTASEVEGEIAAVATRHGFSAAAVTALRDAMRRGGGRMAQFSHPELGGMGQWSGGPSGGMLQIGAMFDHALKDRVAAVCADLAARAAVPPTSPPPLDREAAVVDRFDRAGGGWWPGGLGRPAASGSQGGTRYAYFAEARRLAVERAGHLTLYDTGRHRIFGVSQSMGGTDTLAFTADDGTVVLDGLRVVDR